MSAVKGYVRICCRESDTGENMKEGKSIVLFSEMTSGDLVLYSIPVFFPCILNRMILTFFSNFGLFLVFNHTVTAPVHPTVRHSCLELQFYPFLMKNN